MSSSAWKKNTKKNIGNEVSYRGYKIVRNSNSKFNVFKGGGEKVKCSLEYLSINSANSFINHFR
jgi:hypothetical protein